MSAPLRTTTLIRRIPRLFNPLTTISFTVQTTHAPAFRSAVEEFSNQLGQAVEQPHHFATEASITEAIIAFGSLRAAVNAAVPKSDPHFSL